MLKNVSIGGKLLIGICSTMIITFAVYTTVIVNKATEIAIHDATALAVQMARTHGNHVQNSIEKALDASKATAAAFISMAKHKDAADRDIADEIIWEVTLSDPTFYGTQVVFEPNALDGKDSRYAGTKKWYGKNGRYGPYFWKGEGGKKLAVDLIQYEPEVTRAWYKKPRDTRKPVLTEPYYSDVAETTMATVSVPMLSGGKFLGIVGIDFTLTEFQQMVEDITPMGEGYAMVASNNGFCVAHPDSDMLTKNIGEAFPDDVRNDLLRSVENGKRWVRQLPSKQNGGQEYLYVFEPVNIQGTNTPWTIGIAIPMAQITKEAGTFLNLTIILSVTAICIILLVVLVIVRSLTRPLGIMLSAAQAVSRGDFDAVPDESHFSGELLNLHRALGEMVGSLIGYIETAKQKTEEAEKQTQEAARMARETEKALEEAKRARQEGMTHAAEQLETIASRVSDASDNIYARINEANSGADIQRQRSAETATAMEEMNASVLEVARGAGSTADSAEEARNNADEGASIVSSVVEAISRVHEETARLESGLNELGEQAEGIGTVMNVITDIADQTNLLALNAAIEAARAGDAGRGFAVVADEVRKLAEKTMTATKEVGQAVNAIQNGTRRNIDGMQETARTVNDATELANKAGDALRNIMSIVDSTADQVRNIATASEQQSSASDEINQGTEEINQIASETVQSMSQATEAVQELARLSEQMNQLIVDLKQG